jgi:predicted  nucleic acid-binding Zn-ribbon protein
VIQPASWEPFRLEGSSLKVLTKAGPMANDDETEVDWHRKRIAENRTLLDELEAGNEAGDEVFPETQAEIERLEAQIEQSELIVAAHEKQIAPK